MIQRLVDFALRMPFIILACATCLVIAGLGAYARLDIEAYPNPVPPLVEIITQPDGWSAEEVERYVTCRSRSACPACPASSTPARSRSSA